MNPDTALVLLTFGLLVITGIYAWLTNRIATASSDSAEAAKRSADAAEKAARASQAVVELEHAREHNRRVVSAGQLNDLAVMTIHELNALEEAALARLPGLKQAALWEPTRASEIQRLSIELNHERPAAASAGRDLRYLSSHVERIQAAPPDAKVSPRPPDWDEFRRRINYGRESLMKVVKGLKEKVDSKPEGAAE